MVLTEKDKLQILSHFILDSKPISCKPFGNGHINKTFEVRTENGGHYILQQVNDNVFKDIEMLMKNINYVSSYLISKGFESLQLVRTINGKLYHKENGLFFRVYIFSPNSTFFEKADPDSPLITETSEAYGDLHNNLSGIDASQLGEVIPDFHNTEKRYKNFLKAVEINYNDRVKDCENDIKDIMSFQSHFSVINEGLKNKEINYTVTHNDPKINNVLFDKDRYAKKMKHTLTKKEKELLPFSIFLMAIELAIRFLDDYLRGDVYFRVYNEDDNLTRARTQLHLAKDIYQNLDKLNKMTEKILEQ